jgi:hypothetical protein
MLDMERKMEVKSMGKQAEEGDAKSAPSEVTVRIKDEMQTSSAKPNSSSSSINHTSFETPASSSISQIKLEKEEQQEIDRKTSSNSNSNNNSSYEEQEQEIQHLDTIIQDMLSRGSNRDLVKQTALYLKHFPQHSIRFQIKIKQVKLVDTQTQRKRERERVGRLYTVV